jgi:HAMP domain-containing protein
MKLLFKFNLIFVFAFGVGLLVAAYISNVIVQNNAKEQVLQQARLMMETALSTRSYTTKQIAPLLKSQRYQMEAVLTQFEQSVDSTAKTPVPFEIPGLSDAQKTAVQNSIVQAMATAHDKAVAAMAALPKDNPNEVFNPQSVPAYAATENFNYLREKYPEYSYKEATLNPTNPRDRTSDWEADVVNNFRNNPKLPEMFGTRTTAAGDELYLARPITITAASCLDCHSTPDKAPPAMIKLYGPANGFNWKLNETVGAQLVQVPMSLPVKMANHAFGTLLGSLVGVFLLTLVILNIVLHVTVIKPVAKLSMMADEVSSGKMDVEEVPVKGSDEISVLAKAFNRMQRSLIKALKMLDE